MSWFGYSCPQRYVPAMLGFSWVSMHHRGVPTANKLSFKCMGRLWAPEYKIWYHWIVFQMLNVYGMCFIYGNVKVFWLDFKQYTVFWHEKTVPIYSLINCCFPIQSTDTFIYQLPHFCIRYKLSVLKYWFLSLSKSVYRLYFLIHKILEGLWHMAGNS